jgi:2-amino-4-hydroxy-6-hydroxymethyldihydropteridine diphosphokinase
LRALDVVGRVVRRSALYETAPVGPPQPAFLNAAARVATDLAPHALLDALLSVERQQGRVRGERWGPRLIDLDILWIAGVAVDSPGLVVPHPELRRRAFALRPLLDVAPEATDPRDGVAYREIVAGFGAESALKIEAEPDAWP